MALYRWNVEVSGAFWESLAYFEVAIRNAIDDRMRGRQVRFGRPGNWLFDDARELGRDANGAGRHRRPYAEVDEAIRRVRRNGKKIDPGQIISELSFGFWHQMVSRRQMALWPDLASAFPHARTVGSGPSTIRSAGFGSFATESVTITGFGPRTSRAGTAISWTSRGSSIPRCGYSLALAAGFPRS
jgi:hypothetical protein